MQQRSIFSAAFVFLVSLASLVSASSTNAVAQARYFLRSHAADAPNSDELAELRTANPDAYAIVKALLTKRSLGLLDPKHPTASFTKVEQQPSENQGPEAFAKFASPGELAAHSQQEASAAPADVPYAEVQSAPAHHDWLNWKPQSSAMDDETMVQNVLGAVAELKGKKAGLLSKQRQNNDNPLVAEAATLGDDQHQANLLSKRRQNNENVLVSDAATLSDDSDLLAGKAPPAKPVATHENSYLKGLGLDLSGDMPQTVAASDDNSKKISQAQSSTNNYLASFSWDESKSQEQPQAKVDQPQPKLDPKEANLLSWLGVMKKAPERQRKAPAQQAPPSNPYIMDLSS